MSVGQAFGDLLFWAAVCALCILGFVLVSANHSRWALVVLVAIIGLAVFGLTRQGT